jgi:hypothetical protein
MNLRRAAAGALLAMAALGARAASPFDGFWMRVNDDKSLDPGSQVEYSIEKNVLTMNTPAGQSYRAKLDGSDAPMANHPNITSVSVKLEGRNTLVETAKRQGKAWFVTTIEVDAGGKTAKVSWKNLTNNQAGSYTMSRQ